MMTRSIAALLCLLYLSVSTVLAAVHHHDGAFDDQHCAACSWHHDGTVDDFAVTPRVTPPEFVLIVEEAARCDLSELSLAIHPCRGPPALLL
jgi:hypothetical protein